MKIVGIIACIFLALILFVGVNTDDANADHLKSKAPNYTKELKPIDVTKSVKITQITKSRTLHVWNIVQVQVCAGTEKLYSPDLELRSDRDVIKVTIWGLIMPKSCKTNEFFIRADDSNSISVSFLDSSTISQIRHEKV